MVRLNLLTLKKKMILLISLRVWLHWKSFSMVQLLRKSCQWCGCLHFLSQWCGCTFSRSKKMILLISLRVRLHLFLSFNGAAPPKIFSMMRLHLLTLQKNDLAHLLKSAAASLLSWTVLGWSPFHPSNRTLSRQKLCGCKSCTHLLTENPTLQITSFVFLLLPLSSLMQPASHPLFGVANPLPILVPPISLSTERKLPYSSLLLLVDSANMGKQLTSPKRASDVIYACPSWSELYSWTQPSSHPHTQ